MFAWIKYDDDDDDIDCVYLRSLTAKTVEDSSNNQPQARDNRLPATSDV